MVMPKSTYEESRQKRLEENRKRMEELNLNKLSQSLRTPKPSLMKSLIRRRLKNLKTGWILRLFDVNPLLLLRPDGHSGPYRFFQPFARDKNAKVIDDCLH